MLEKVDYARSAERYIRELVSDFVSNPFNFFSESDVKCRLFNMMFQNSEIGRLKRTMDGRQIYPLHSEVTYFNREGRLLYHVDLSAVEPEETDVYSNPQTEGIRFSKGYSAPECLFAIELKLNKRNKKEKMLSVWEKDMEKLADILSRNPSLTCFCMLLDKKNRISEENELADLEAKYPRVKLVYANASGMTFFKNFEPLRTYQ
jgi:hypothetical protein